MRMTIATMNRCSPFIDQIYVAVTIFMNVFITKLILLPVAMKVSVNVGPLFNDEPTAITDFALMS